MAGNVKLMTSAGGGVILDTATTTASDVTVKVPAVNGDVVLTNVAGTVALAATGANIITASTNGSERMRIDSAGITKFKSTGAAYDSTPGDGVSDGLYLQVDSSGIAHIDSYAGGGSTILAFGTNSGGGAVAERMRIAANGDFLVGTTNNSASVGNGFKITAGSGNADSVSIVTGATSNSGLTTYQLYSTGAGAYRFYVGAGGNIYATSTTITGISDQRLKENIRDLDDGLEAIMALQPRKFDWKEGKGKDIKDDRGFIAQEFEQVFPDLIDEWKDPAPEGEEPYKSVRPDLIPVLVKAIQEQQAQIETLTAKVAALEAK